MKSSHYSLYEKKKVWLFFSLIMIIQLSFAQNHQPKPLSSHHSHSSDHCSRVSHENDGPIPSAKPQDNTFGIAKKAACQYSTNAQWGGLSTSALISAMRQTGDYDCYRDLFQYSSYSPGIFSNDKVKAVANEVRNLASSYNGTNSTGIYGLTIYLHIAIYLDFYQTSIDLTPDTYSAVHGAVSALGSNSSLFSHNLYAMGVLEEIVIVAGDIKTRNEPASINLFERVLRDFAVTESWKSITDTNIANAYANSTNKVYNAYYNVVSDEFVNALVSDNQSIGLLAKAATSNALISKGGNFKYLWQNATGALAILAKSDKLIGSIQGHLAAITNHFPKLSPSWAKAKMALNQYGDCSAYNLCQHPLSIRQEIEEYLFPKTVSYDDDEMIIRTPISDEKIQELYHAAKQVQSQFFRLIQTDQPVAGDKNTTINMIVFGSKEQYDDYASLLFGIRTDNGGMYIEAISTFYTWDRTVGVESSLSLESLFRHEYCHYLQGRYLIPGNWGVAEIYKNSRMVWYEEGMADFFAGSTDTNGVQMLAQNTRAIINQGSGWPTLNTVFNSSYTSGNFYHYTYGNAAWYNWYLNNFDYLKRFFEYTRNNDIAGFDSFVSQLRSGGETSYNNFLNKVKNEEVIGWQPTTGWADDNQISIGSPSGIQNEMGSLPNTSNISVAMDAEKSYRRFKITGKITGSGTGIAAKDIARQLDKAILKLRENKLVNNFKYTVGYFKNLNSSGSRSADFIITGPLKDADISDNPIADFSATNTTTIAGGKVDFINESTGYITGLDWSFPSGSPSSATNEQTPQITYNSSGEYNVTLTAKGAGGSSNTKTIQKYIKVYPSGTNTYCSSVNEGGGDVHIKKVKLGAFENASGYTTPYVDYTSQAAIIRTTQSTPLSITIHNEQWTYNALGVWIDWNQDGDFVDSGEEIIRKFAPGPYTKQITPPSGAKLGTTRMRVRMSYGSEGSITPCGTQNSIGETEDYSIVVTNEQASVNTPPVITLLKPSNGQTFVQKENIAVETVIKDDKKVEKAELKVDGELISADYEAPFQWTHINKLNFLSPGQHELRVIAYDSDGATDSKSITLNIEKAPITFCDASNEDGTLHITKVIFGSINNTTTHNPYSDHTNLSTVVQKGGQVALTINTINEDWTYNGIGAWIDWNQDGDFIDTNEEVYSNFGPGPFNTTVTVPSSAVTGAPLRMRVRMIYGAKDKIVPCGNDTYLGEVEDYIVYVGNSTGPSCNDGIQNGDETGVDCGGSCTTPCQPEPTCNDGIQNGNETGIDCGGSCTPCGTSTTYCTAQGNNSATEYISRVQLGTIDNESVAGSGYNDYTSVSTVLSKGNAHTITITPKWTSTVYAEGYSVWIDYNQDNDFDDANEQVWSKAASQDTQVSGNFTVPSGAKSGNTRMRVAMRYNAVPSQCGSFDYGEVEDYTVTIGTGGTSNPTCTDDIQNGDETGVDCGGSCAPCSTGGDGVVYVNMNDVTANSSSSWNFFRIEVGDDNGFGAWFANNSVQLVAYNKDVVCEGTSSNVTLLGEGVQVGSSSNFVAESSGYIISSSDYTNWKGKSGFIGFTFKINNNTHYGWFYATVANDGSSYTILNYAYNKNPNQAITTKVVTGKSFNEYSLDDTIKIAPNPFSNNFVINTSILDKKGLVVKVYDLQGKLLIHKKYGKNPGRITLGEQIKMSGSYFVKITTATTTKTLQVLKY